MHDAKREYGTMDSRALNINNPSSYDRLNLPFSITSGWCAS